MGTDKKHTPIIDEETVPIVRRIFEMYASGLRPRKICEVLNGEGIPTPAMYAYAKMDQKPKQKVIGFWTPVTVREMLNKIIYWGICRNYVGLPFRTRIIKDIERTKATGKSFTTTTNLLFRKSCGTKSRNVKSR